ncbi:hypothetical protein E8E11_009228 [Didymella keratinophila]|nr:hypothetical protein E8E11_009228 [Didymella keratinophila]
MPTHSFQYDESVAEFAVSKNAYLKAHPNATFKLVATAALVLDTSLPTPRILLLQRAASDSYPGKWEPPGGAVDDEDSTILHAAARELWEEAGLQASHISGPVGDPHFFLRSNGDQICRFSFAVHVLSHDGAALRTKLDPNEHQSYVWATEEEVRAGQAGAVGLEFVKEEFIEERNTHVLTKFDGWTRPAADYYQINMSSKSKRDFIKDFGKDLRDLKDHVKSDYENSTLKKQSQLLASRGLVRDGSTAREGRDSFRWAMQEVWEQTRAVTDGNIAKEVPTIPRWLQSQWVDKIDLKLIFWRPAGHGLASWLDTIAQCGITEK